MRKDFGIRQNVRVIGLKGYVRPRTMQEGNKSHNHELKADKRLIFTLARIPQGMQKYTEENASLPGCWHCWDSEVSQLFDYVSFLKSHFELVVCHVQSEC